MRTLLRALLILIVVVVVIAAAGAFFLGYRIGGGPNDRGTVGTTGTTETRPADRQGPIDTSSAREKGAAIGEKIGEAGNRAGAFLSDAALTAKIKSKMSLDDHVKATDVGVSTTDHVVTLTGMVGSEDEHRRALELTRETAGVKSVVDQIRVSGK